MHELTMSVGEMIFTLVAMGLTFIVGYSMGWRSGRDEGYRHGYSRGRNFARRHDS